jgi:hypothetical protein
LIGSRRLRCAAYKGRAYEHAGQQAHTRIGHVDMNGNGACLRVCRRFNKVHVTVKRAVGGVLLGYLNYICPAMCAGMFLTGNELVWFYWNTNGFLKFVLGFLW